MSFTRNILILLLLSQLGFSLWTQPLNISVSDQNGKPVEKAQVTIFYQKASQVSENDGVLTGETNADGYFSAVISNRVPAATASKNIQVRVSTNYWAGETRKLVANETEKKQLRFTVPFKLEDVYVRVLSSRQLPVKGANVVISGKVPLRKATGTDGKARFFFPSNFTFSGFASYSNASKTFASKEVKSADGRKTIDVTLPPLEGEILGSVAGTGKNSLGVAFLGFNDTALPDLKVLFEFDGKNYSVYTDQDGVAGFLSDKTGILNATIREYDYDFEYALNFSAGNNTTAVSAYHLLKVVSFNAAPDGDNCFRLLSNVSDPRPNISIRVKIFRYDGPQNVTLLKVNTTQSGLYYSDLCIRMDTPVRLTASNKYDVAEASLNLTFVRPKTGPVPSKPLNQSLFPGQQEKPKETDDMAVVAIVIGIVCLLSAFFARAYLARSSRFIVEYLRKTNDGIQKRRQKMGVPPVQPPPQNAPPSGQQNEEPQQPSPPSQPPAA